MYWVEMYLPKGAVNLFESAASSVYNGATLSIRRRMTGGLYFMLSYTFAHAIDDFQDALVAGRPATVTDQRQRLAFTWVVAPRPFHRGHEWLGTIFNNWKIAGIATYGGGRPVNAVVTGDANQDGNNPNDRLPGVRRNSFTGPDYATTDVRITRRIYAGDRLKMELVGESFNLLNRDNRRMLITEDGFQSNSGSFVQTTKHIGINYFPAQTAFEDNFLHATSAYAQQQMQLALKLIY